MTDTDPEPIPREDMAGYDPGPCPNCAGTNVRVVGWHNPAGMPEDQTIPSALVCDDCGWRNDPEPEEVPIP